MTASAAPATSRLRQVFLLGNPNAGKSTLFNRLTGLRAKTANFPGTTVERKTARVEWEGQAVQLTDLPGTYSLQAGTPEERLTADALLGQLPGLPAPDLCLAVVDASNLERNLFLVGQLIDQGLPVVVALNMMDLAQRHGLAIDADKLAAELGCPVVPVIATRGEGLDALRQTAARRLAALDAPAAPARPACSSCGVGAGCPFSRRFTWSEDLTSRVVRAHTVARASLTERIDRWATHPVLGVLIFLLVTFSVFFLIFRVAAIPMDAIDLLFSRVAAWAGEALPGHAGGRLISEGIIPGVGGILVFLPQILILFLFLALLEDTGYLARAAFVMDRLMRAVGLPGTAFVPLLSAHACAIPAIMSTRVIQDWRDRLVTILVLPLMTCSARIPVYAMVAGLLFHDRPREAALLFTGAYTLGILAALGMALLFKRTLLPGESQPLVLELPVYRIPSLRGVALQALERGWIFVRQAGSVILVISIVLWVLSSYPAREPSAAVLEKQAEVTRLAAAGESEAAEVLAAEAGRLERQEALRHSFAGRLGRLIEPIVQPLGFDWQIGLGIVSSFAAREVVVSTLAIVYGLGEEGAEDADSLYAALRAAQRPDGTPQFTTATCFSLLVFYVLAMQCLPTQAVTRRETGSWRWALFQLGYMSALAYLAAFLTYQGLRALGLG
jgi:ferrous iron transport protein B